LDPTRQRAPLQHQPIPLGPLVRTTASDTGDVMEDSNYEKKYRSLKKKYKTMTTDKETTDQQLTLAKKRVVRLQKERSFLLDRLLQYEQVSSDSESSSSSSESSEEREADRPAKRIKKEEPAVRVAPTGGYSRRSARPRVRDSSEEQVCIARGKDKPCKSKALQGFKYCWHHAPLDPATGFIFCQYRDVNKRNAKKCNIPVHKDKPEPFCNYHVKRLQRQANVKALGENGDAGGGGSTPHAGGTPQEPEPEVYGEDVFSDGEDGLDVSGSGEEASPPIFQDNVVIN